MRGLQAAAANALSPRVVGTMSIAGPMLRMGPERDAEFHALLGQAAGTIGMVWPRGDSALAAAA